MLSLAHFRLQRRSLPSLIYLFWIYSFVSRAVGAFSQIYIYELFNSVQLAIIAGIVTFTGIMIGFCICGVVAALYRLNAKHGFLLSFLFTGLGLILLPLATPRPRGLRRGRHVFHRRRHCHNLCGRSDSPHLAAMSPRAAAPFFGGARRSQHSCCEPAPSRNWRPAILPA
jgi:MFS family permease